MLMSALSHGRDGFSRQPIQELSVAYLPLEEARVLATVSYRISYITNIIRQISTNKVARKYQLDKSNILEVRSERLDW